LGNIIFSDGASIFTSANDLIYNVPSNDSHIFTVNGLPQITLDGTNIDLHSKLLLGAKLGADLDFVTFDARNVDRIIHVLDSGVVPSVNDYVTYVSSTGDAFVNNVPAVKEFVWTHSNEITFLESETTLEKRAENTDPIFRLYESGNNATAGENIGEFRWAANRVTGGKTDFARITGIVEDAGNTTFEGGMAIQLNRLGNPTPEIFMRFNEGKNNLIDMFKGLSLNTNSISNITIAGIVDTGGIVRGSISGDAAASALRLSTASGEKFIISDVITDIAEFTKTNINFNFPLRLFSTTAKGTLHFIRNDPNPTNNDEIGQLLFSGNDSNLNISSYAEIKVNSPNITAGNERGEIIFQVAVFGGLLTRMSIGDTFVKIHTDLDVLGNKITNVDSIESDNPNRPGSGFIRMAHAEEIRMRNGDNDDDLIISSDEVTLDGQLQDAVSFSIDGGVRMYVGRFDISVETQDIVETGDVLPHLTGGNVGDGTNFYNQMHSQFFVPEGAAVITNRFGLSKTGNTLYVNFDNANADAGFSIYEQGFESFRFFHPTSTVNAFHIGNSDVFTAGEEYRIQMGENGNSSARITFTEGTNDLLINRQGVATSFGVKLQSAGATRLYARAADVLLSVPLNMGDLKMINVKGITTNGDLDETIGELVTGDGGFNYFMRDTLAWDADPNVKLTFGAGGISLETDGSNDDIDILAKGSSSDIDIRAADDGILSLGRINFEHLQIGSTFTIFSNANISLTNGAQEIQFLDSIAGTAVTAPISDHITLFNDATTGNLSVKKPGGAVVDLESGGGGGDVFLAATQTFTGFNTFNDNTTFNDDVIMNEGVILGSTSSDNISLLGQVNTDIVMEEISEPANAGINTGRFYAKVSGGVSVPFWKDEVGTESIMIGGGSLDGIQDAKQTIDHETNQADFTFWLSNTKQGNSNAANVAGIVGTPTQNQIYYLPIYIGERYRIERVGVDVAVLNVNDWSAAIYDTYPGQNYPRNRITNSTNTFLNTTGINSILFNEDVEPGLYWIAIWFDNGNSQQLRYWQGTNANCVGWFPENGTTGTMTGILGYIEINQISSSLPSVADDEMAPLIGPDAPAVFAKLIFNPN